MAMMLSSQSFTLANFEGPLDFLLHLVQKSEIDIYEIPIQELIDQFLRIMQQEVERDVDNGAEFLALAAQLMLIKSRTLLPKHEQETEDSDGELDPHFEVIHALLEYCQFRDAGKDLSLLEEQQTGHHFRGVDEETKIAKLSGGVAHLSLDDLAGALQEAMERAASRCGDDIEEEEYRVIDKIREIRRRLKLEHEIAIEEVFSPSLGRNELIVYFLAILEMMKLGELAGTCKENGQIVLTPQERDG